MNAQEITLSQEETRKLLSAKSPDTAILYIYLRSGNDPKDAAAELQMKQAHVDCSLAALRQLGLWQTERKTVIQGDRPAYSELDVISAADNDRDFRHIYGEVQHQLGRNLNTEEMKILLGFIRYLGLPPEVVSMLVRYCRERQNNKNGRAPSLRSIEKEAYFWAEQGIDTMDEACAFIQRQSKRNSQMGQLKQALQIHDRSLTATEEKYAQSWLEMGFHTDAIAMAYDLACVHTGNRNWKYMNAILSRWHTAGVHTAAQVKALKEKEAVPAGASGKLGAAELANIQKLLQEDK